MKPEDLERLVTVAMPFGKHKGCLIADLLGHYLALMHELDHNGLNGLLAPLRRR